MLAEILQQINKEKVWKGVCYFLVILGTLMIQNLLMPHLTILKVRPLIIPAAAVAVGMFEGGTYGAIFGLFLGFFADMSFAENTVLFLVIMGVLGFAAGFAADFYLNRTFIPFMAVYHGVRSRTRDPHRSAADGVGTALCRPVLPGDPGHLPALRRTVGAKGPGPHLNDLTDHPFTEVCYAE